MRQASEGLCGVQAELVPGYVCSGAWFWCNKLQCAGIISPYFRPDFTSVTERGHRAKERVWWLHVRVKRSRDQHPTSCVCVCLSICGREGERACTWVCCFAYLAEDIFFSLRWTEPVKKKKKNSLPPSLSLILFAQSFHFLASLQPRLQMHSNSATNFILYFCQSLHFPFTSTHSLVNPPRLQALDILI